MKIKVIDVPHMVLLEDLPLYTLFSSGDLNYPSLCIKTGKGLARNLKCNTEFYPVPETKVFNVEIKEVTIKLL